MVKWLFIILICTFNHVFSQVTPIYNDPLNAVKTNHPYLIQAMEMIRFGDASGAVRLLRQDANFYEIICFDRKSVKSRPKELKNKTINF